jgi:hypothetical protein
MYWLDLKHVLTLFYLIATCSAVVFLSFGSPTYMDEENVLIIALFCIKFGVSGTFNSLFLLTNIIVPADIVPTTFAVCNIISRLITITAPIVSDRTDNVAIIIVLGTSLLSSYFVNLVSSHSYAVEHQ